MWSMPYYQRVGFDVSSIFLRLDQHLPVWAEFNFFFYRRAAAKQQRAVRLLTNGCTGLRVGCLLRSRKRAAFQKKAVLRRIRWYTRLRSRGFYASFEY